MNPLQYQGKLGSTLDRSKYFSVDRFKNAYQLKINSSTAFEEGEHRQLKDILKQVMASAAVVSKHPQGDKSRRNSGGSPTQMYTQMIGKHRSRVDKGQAALQGAVSGSTIENLKAKKHQIHSPAPFSHSMLIAVKKNVGLSDVRLSGMQEEYGSKDSNSAVEQNSQGSNSRDGSIVSLERGKHSSSLQNMIKLKQGGGSMIRLLPKMHTRVPSTIKLSE